jgi:hypothetical protein
MPKTVFVVTTTELQDTGKMSVKFMIRDGIPTNELIRYAGVWGLARRRRKDDNEVNPWKLVREEKGAIGDDGVRRWDLHLFKSDGFLFCGNVDEIPTTEEGLKELISSAFENIDRAVLLIPRNDFDAFEAACNDIGIEVKSHHYDGALSTS